MDFRFSTEQGMLRDSARDFLSTKQSFERRQRYLDRIDLDCWQQFAELGWLAMAVPEDMDGLGSSMTDIAIMCEEFGRGLSISPFIASAVLPARLLGRAKRGDAVAELLPALAVGSMRAAVAFHEHGHRYDAFRPGVHASRQTDGSYILTGQKIIVSGGAAADVLIVSARVIDECGADVSAMELFLVDTKQMGIVRRVYRTIDDAEVADLGFHGASVPAEGLLSFDEGAAANLERSLDEAAICLCADLLGGMSAALELTSEYLHTREQFGQPLARFQALQHALAEMFIEASDARSMVYQGIGALSEPDAQRRKAVSACKAKVTRAAKLVTGNAVHLHGGIGVTCEYPVGHYLRRTMVAERTYGDSDYHLDRYLDSAGTVEAGG
jgi:acyl-CoA dehydrogenase